MVATVQRVAIVMLRSVRMLRLPGLTRRLWRMGVMKTVLVLEQMP